MMKYPRNGSQKKGIAGLLWLFVISCLFSCSPVAGVEEIPLPHVDIFMLCSNDIDTANFDYSREMTGFFTDLLPSAVDVTITSGSQDFAACTANATRTIVTFSSDGVAEFSANNPLTQKDIQSLVSVLTLKAYFEKLCSEVDTFEAIVSDAGSDPEVGVEAGLTRFLCNNNVETVFNESIETAAVVVIVISVVVVLCILGGICLFCGFCSNNDDE